MSTFGHAMCGMKVEKKTQLICKKRRDRAKHDADVDDEDNSNDSFMALKLSFNVFSTQFALN